MIKRLDIDSFGSFQKFVWKNSVRDKGNNVAEFKKLNILYGKNYSGKTTISRIIRSLETGILPDKYESPSFVVTLHSGQVTQTKIPSTELDIRVYNRDFVDDHLSFLRDGGGKITPFTVIGSENKTIEEQINKKENELGDIESKIGLRYRYHLKNSEAVLKKKDQEGAQQSLDDKLRKKATQQPTGIKHNSLYKDPNYNTPKIIADIQTVQSQSFEVLNDPSKTSKAALLGETALPDIADKLRFNSSIKSLLSTANELVSRKITPTKPIQDLLNDSLLQTWVKQGIAYHKGKRDSCGFCGQSLPGDIWSKLDEHFSKESTELERSLESHILTVERECDAVAQIVSVDKTDFYSTLQSSFDSKNKNLVLEIAKYKASLDKMIFTLRARMADIFTPQQHITIDINIGDIITKIDAINTLIDKNNKKTGSLAQDQINVRNELRLSEVAQFILDINYSGELQKIDGLTQLALEKKTESSQLFEEILELEKEIEKLKIQLKDEKKGAETVNKYLNHYFGHEGLHLEAVEDANASTFKFQIMRGDRLAYNLSEGECSLVSFCYFIAKLEDSESKDKKLVIYIDDPISSLDSNHIFFVFSLIEALIARPAEDNDGNRILDAQNKPIFGYDQLFISTHNLEFLKYLKKLSMPKKDHEHFLVIAGKNGSQIELMPEYLREYVTEFNYLFGEIYTCTNASNATDKHHSFYNFGNNLRKFLEAYLFFKYPFHADSGDYNKRIKEFFMDEPSTDVLVQRITNEFSHLGGYIDRGVEPIDHAEIAKLASFIMKKIKDNDAVQFEYLLLSINQPDPFDPAKSSDIPVEGRPYSN